MFHRIAVPWSGSLTLFVRPERVTIDGAALCITAASPEHTLNCIRTGMRKLTLLSKRSSEGGRFERARIYRNPKMNEVENMARDVFIMQRFQMIINMRATIDRNKGFRTV